MVVLSTMCDSADEQQSQLQMPHALGLVVGLPLSNRLRQEAVFVLFIISMKLYVALDCGFLCGWRR